MAEFNGKQGRWVTVEGRHLFIEDGKDLDTAIKSIEGKSSNTAPKIRRDIGNRVGKSYDAVKEDLTEIFDYLTADATRQKDFFDTLKKVAPTDSEAMLDAQIALKKNDPQKLYRGGYTSMPQFLRAYAKMTEPDITDEELNDLPLPSYMKRNAKSSDTEDAVDKQEKEIAEREKQTKELNDEKKANDYESRKQEIVDKYRKELKGYLKDNNGKLPRKLNMGTTIAQRDAVLTALDAEYTLSPAEEKVWDKVQFQGHGKYIWLPGKSPIEITGLSQKAISGLRKWLSVWGAEHLD